MIYSEKYEMLFYKLLGFVVNEMGMDANDVLDNIGVQNLHEQDEILLIKSLKEADE